MTFMYYGRRVCKWRNPTTGKIVYTWSGQWVGHAYGDSFGSPRQREHARPRFDKENKEFTLMGVSGRIFWKQVGIKTGDTVQPGEEYTPDKLTFV